MWYICTMEYYSTIKKDEIIPFAATCMDLEIIIPSEVSPKVKMKVKSLSRVRLFGTLWTVAHQAPLSMGFSRQEYWSGLPLPFPGDLHDPGIELRSPALQVDALTSEPPGMPRKRKTNTKWYHLYLESKIWYKWTYLPKRNRLTDMENKFMVTKGGRCGGEIS